MNTHVNNQFATKHSWPQLRIKTPIESPDPKTPIRECTRGQTRARQMLEMLQNLTPIAHSLTPTNITNTITFIDGDEHQPAVDESKDGDEPMSINQSNSEQQTLGETNASLNAENAMTLLSNHIRQTVQEMNNALDDGDAQDDAALATDVLSQQHMSTPRGSNHVKRKFCTKVAKLDL